MIRNRSVRRLLPAVDSGFDRRAVSRLLPGALVFLVILTLGLGEAVFGQNPTCSIAVGTGLIYDGDLVQEVTVTYSEAMSATPTPTIQFLTTIGTWAPGSGTWDLAQHVWTQSFTVSDANEETSGIGVYVSGAQNVGGSAQVSNTLFAAFNADTRNPVAPAVTGIATDAGSSNADAVTNDSTLILSGTAEPQSSVRLHRDGSPMGAPVAAKGTGNWTFDYQGTSLADGTYSFTATATDSAGNVSPESAPLTVLVEQQGAPAPEGRTPPDGTWTNDNTPTFSWATTPGDPGGSGVRDYGYDIAGPTPKSSTTANTTYTPSSSSPLSDGAYTWKLRTRDVAGNPGSYGSSWTLVIDTANPSVSTVVADTATVYDGDLMQKVTVTFDEPMDTAVAPAITFSTGTWTPGAVGTWNTPAATVWMRTYTLTDNQETAANVTVDVTGAQDVAGNAQQDYTPLAEFDIDTQNPAAPSIPDLTSGSDLGESSTDDVTRDNTPEFGGTAEANSKVEVSSRISGRLGTTTAPGGAWTFTVLGSEPLVDGIHNVCARATDGAGNVGPWSTELPVRIDTQAPTCSVPDLLTADDTGQWGTDNVTKGDAPHFDGTASDANGVWKVDVTASDSTTGTDNSASPFYDVSLATLDEGARTVAATVTDVAGNTFTSANLMLSVDRTAPACSVPDLLAADDTGQLSTDDVTQGTTPQFDGTASDANGVWRVDVTSDDGKTGTDSASPFYSVELATLTQGTLTVSATVTDVAGNTFTSGNLTLTVDRTVPTCSVPDLLTADDTGQWGTDNVTKGDAPHFDGTASDANGVWKVDVTASDATTGTDSASPFYSVELATLTQGTLTVSATVTDVAGNTFTSGSLTLTVDRTSPTCAATTNHTTVTLGAPIHEGSLVLTVVAIYNESMDTSREPSIQLTGGMWGPQTRVGTNGWSTTTRANDTYTATFAHTEVEEPLPPPTAISAVARVPNGSGAADIAGNANVGDDSPTFEIDTRKPELIPDVAAVAIDTDAVYEGDLTQRVTVTFDEAMHTGTTPAIVFGHGTWTTNRDGVWSAGNTIWTVTYTLADHDEEYYSLTGNVVTVDVVGALDAAGNLQEPYAAEPEFDIDTLQPEITEFTSVPDGGRHVAGDTIDITVAFSESVFGALTLNLDSGGIVDVLGVVSSESETRTYTIQWGENSCDLDVESAVVDAGGDLVDWAGNYAHWMGGATNLSLPTGYNLADKSAIIVDTTLPIAVTDPDDDETRSGADSDIVEVRLDPQGRYRLMVRQDTPVYIDVLANDIELPCLSHLSVYDFPVLPTYGTIPDENPANPVRYAPYAGYIGPDEFTYRAVDACGNISVEATVYVEVIPQLVFADVYVTACAAASVAIDVAATDLFVPPGAPEDAEFAFEIVEGPEHGIVAGDPTEVEITEPGTSTLFIESATVKFIYAPASGFVGRDQFRVRFSDPFGGVRAAVIDIEVQACPWVEEAPLVIPQGALLPLIVPLSFASVYETAWDTVTLTGEDGAEHPEALLATWNESLERPTLVVDTGPLALGGYELVIPLGNGEIVTLRFAVVEKP
jgi:hypothetical protein